MFRVPSKRQRESSDIASRASRSTGRSSSSKISSSPAFRPQSVGATQQRPRKRVSLHPPTSRESSTASPRGVPSTTSSSHGSPLAPGEAGPAAEEDAVIDQREENDAVTEVVMALDMRERGTVGCCYYVAREEKLYFMEDVKFGGVDVIDTCKKFLHSHQSLGKYLTCPQ